MHYNFQIVVTGKRSKGLTNNALLSRFLHNMFLNSFILGSSSVLVTAYSRLTPLLWFLGQACSRFKDAFSHKQTSSEFTRYIKKGKNNVPFLPNIYHPIHFFLTCNLQGMHNFKLVMVYKPSTYYVDCTSYNMQLQYSPCFSVAVFIFRRSGSSVILCVKKCCWEWNIWKPIFFSIAISCTFSFFTCDTSTLTPPEKALRDCEKDCYPMYQSLLLMISSFIFFNILAPPLPLIVYRNVSHMRVHQSENIGQFVLFHKNNFLTTLLRNNCSSCFVWAVL